VHGARQVGIVDADHLTGDGLGLVAQKVGDDRRDPPGGARLVDVDRLGVDRDVTLEERE